MITARMEFGHVMRVQCICTEKPLLFIQMGTMVCLQVILLKFSSIFHLIITTGGNDDGKKKGKKDASEEEKVMPLKARVRANAIVFGIPHMMAKK